MLAEPAKLYKESHPDLAPTIDMGRKRTIKKTSKPLSLKRHNRWKARSARRRRLCLEEIDVDCNDNQESTNPALVPQNEPQMAELYRIFEETETEVPEVNVTTASTGTQTDLS